jgi:hypothetical protein
VAMRRPPDTSILYTNLMMFTKKVAIKSNLYNLVEATAYEIKTHNKDAIIKPIEASAVKRVITSGKLHDPCCLIPPKTQLMCIPHIPKHNVAIVVGTLRINDILLDS